MDAQETPQLPTGSARNGWQRSWDFARELWNDHDFWIRAFAVKGGASAIVIAGVIGVSYVVALPFILAAVGVAACIGLIGFGLGGVFLGATTGWDKLKQIYSKTFSTLPPEENPAVVKSSFQRMAESPRVKKLLEKPFMKKLADTRAWKTAQKLTEKQKDIFLAGLAMKGSIVATIIGGAVLATHVLVFSIVAIPFTVIAATAGLASGLYGMYLSAQSLFHSCRAPKNEETEFPAPSPQPKTDVQTAKAPREKTRIAGFFLPGLGEDSVLFPSDRWIVTTAVDILKTNRELQKNLSHAGFYATLAVACAAGGIAGAVTAVPVLAGGIALAALAGVVTFAQKTRCCWNDLKTETLPKLRIEIASRYIKLKSGQLADALKRRVAEKQGAKQSGEKAESPAEEKTPAEKRSTSLSAKFGNWALKKAAEKMQQPKAPPPPKPPQG